MHNNNALLQCIVVYQETCREILFKNSFIYISADKHCINYRRLSDLGRAAYLRPFVIRL